MSAAIYAADEQIKSAEAVLELAKKEHVRAKTLFEQNAIAKRTFDEAGTALKQAEAAKQQAIQQKRAAQAQAAAAGQSIKQAEVGYEYATVLSPIDGIVAERLADPGDLGNPSSVILRIFDPKTMLLEVPIRESLVKDVKVGTEVIYVSALDKEYEGKVIEVVPYVDPSTRTFLAKISIDNPSELMPGMYGTVKIPLNQQKRYINTRNSLNKTGQLESVTEVKDKTQYRRQVKTVKSSDGMLEVVSGLTPGQQLLNLHLNNSYKNTRSLSRVGVFLFKDICFSRHIRHKSRMSRHDEENAGFSKVFNFNQFEFEMKFLPAKG